MRPTTCRYYPLAFNPDNVFFPTITWYNKARLEALRNDLEESIKSLKIAIELDNSLWGKVMGEHEFDNIRDTPEFRKLIWDE